MIERTIFDCRLDDAIERFERSWREEGTADVRDFLPSRLTGEERRIGLELLRVDLQYRWRAGEHKSTAEYRDDYPDLLSDEESVLELAYEEFRMAEALRIPLEPAVLESTLGIRTSRWPTVPVPEGVEPELDRAWDDSLRWLKQLDALPAVGEQVGEFRIDEILGQGTFAVVYLAQQMGLANRPVVLKITGDRSFEPDKMARLQHARIVPIYSVHDHGGMQVLCMPYLGRRTLKDLLERELSALPAGREAIRERLEIVRQIAEGLQHAHHRGLVHRDVKPGNILVTDDRGAMLMDFNLSDDLLSGGTTSAMVGGTLPYLAPEHLAALRDGARITPAADLYSLGVIAYQMLAGRLPFPHRAGEFGEVVERMMADRQTSLTYLRQLNPHVPASVASVVAKLLSPSLDERYATAESLLEDLDRFQQNQTLRHAADRSLLERWVRLVRRHPVICSNTGLLVISIAMVALATAGWLTARHRLEVARANRAWHEIERRAPGLLATLSSPIFEDSDAREAAVRTESLLATFAAPGLGTKNVGKGLSAVGAIPWHSLLGDGTHAHRWELLEAIEQRQLCSTSADLAFALSSYHLMRGRIAREADQPDWREELGSAEQWSQVGRVWSQQLARYTSEGTRADSSGDGSLWTWQERQIQLAISETTPPVGPTDGEWLRPSMAGPSYQQASYRRAMAALQAGDYIASAKILERLRDQHPHDGAVWLLLGNAYAGQTLWSEAEHCYEVCLALWPRSILGHFFRGLARLDQGNYDEAEGDFSRCLEIQPALAAAYVNRAAAHTGLETHSEALADLNAALKLDPTRSRWWLLRAKVHQRMGNHSAAQADRERGIQLEPDTEYAWVERGMARWTQEPAKALDDFQRALSIRPGFRPALRNIAYLLGERQGQWAAALPFLEELVDRYQHPDDQVSLAVFRARLGDRTACELVREVEQQRPTSKQWFQIACVYSLLGDNDRDVSYSLDALERAWFEDFRWLRMALTDPDLARVRESEAFERLHADATRRHERRAALKDAVKATKQDKSGEKTIDEAISVRP